MSLKQMILAFNVEVGNPIRKLILLKLADNADDSGYSWPSHENIAKAAECSRRSVIRHIKSLEDGGFLKVTNNYRHNIQKQNCYQLTLRCDNGSTAVTMGQDAVTMGPNGMTESHTEPIIEPVIRTGQPINAQGADVCPDCNGTGSMFVFGADGVTCPCDCQDKSVPPLDTTDKPLFPEFESGDMLVIDAGKRTVEVEKPKTSDKDFIEQIWKAYPRKKQKPAGIRAIKNALKKIEFSELLDKVKEYAESIPPEKIQYTPYPQKWFNQEMWNDIESEFQVERTYGGYGEIDLSGCDEELPEEWR